MFLYLKPQFDLSSNSGSTGFRAAVFTNTGAQFKVTMARYFAIKCAENGKLFSKHGMKQWTSADC